MPRQITSHGMTSAEATALNALGIDRYCYIVEHGHTFIVEEGNELYDRYSDELYEVGTIVFALDIDGSTPYGDYGAFFNYNSVYPEDWTPFGCSNCADEGCRECTDEDTYDPYGEETSDDPGANVSRLFVKSLKDRPTRLTSVEIEVGMGGNYLAERLNQAGLSEYAHMGGYHDMDDDSFARVEEDSSVAAEVIFSRMRLNEAGHAGDFETGIGIIRSAINESKCKLDMRCGLHIHVNLAYDGEKISCYGMDDVASLYHLWNYVEDTVFRLGSANWKGHRSEYGNDYAPKTHKGLNRGTEIGRHFNGSRGALNLSNYLGARHNCRCGAFDFGNWRECTCVSMGRSTVEFRVFNTSANSRKIRAYIALCQALVSAAAAKRFSPDEYPALDWNESRELDVAASKERLEFILNELSLTNDERQDILYCAEKSSLSTVLDTEYLRVLWANNE